MTANPTLSAAVLTLKYCGACPLPGWTPLLPLRPRWLPPSPALSPAAPEVALVSAAHLGAGGGEGPRFASASRREEEGRGRPGLGAKKINGI